MSDKIHHARCCGCNLQINVDGLAFRGDADDDADFDNMRQAREAAKNHRWFCTNYTGEFHITANWYVDVVA